MNQYLSPLSTCAGTLFFEWGMSNILGQRSMKQGLFKVAFAVAAIATRVTIGEQTFSLDQKLVAGTTGVFLVASAMRDLYLGFRSKKEAQIKHHYTNAIIKQAIAIPVFAGLLYSVISQEISKPTMLYGIGATLSFTSLPILISAHCSNSVTDLKRGIELLGVAVLISGAGLLLEKTGY